MSTRKVMIGFKTDIEIKERLEEIANREDRSISYIVNRLITRALQEEANEESAKAQVVLDYIESLKYSSYEEFIRITMKDKKYKWIKQDLGELQAYLLVCDKLGIEPKNELINSLEN